MSMTDACDQKWVASKLIQTKKKNRKYDSSEADDGNKTC